MTPTLEPTGVHQSPKGSTRYAIWLWTDADGETRLPCAVIATLDRVPPPASDATCATPRRKVCFPAASTMALRRIMLRDGLIDAENRLTEKGAVIRFHFQRRALVRAGFETPHGLRKRAVAEVPY